MATTTLGNSNQDVRRTTVYWTIAIAIVVIALITFAMMGNRAGDIQGTSDTGTPTEMSGTTDAGNNAEDTAPDVGTGSADTDSGPAIDN